MKQYQAFPAAKRKTYEKRSKSVFNLDISSFKNKDGKKDINTAKNRKLSSTIWLTRHINDKFCQMSKEYGFKSRASFKLIEIVDKFNLHKNILRSDVVVDLGCAPGGWTQVLEGYILDKQARQQKTTKLIALDIIKTEYITNNICFIEGDFEDNAIKEKIILETGGLKIGLILSDIAPNNIGHQSADRLTVSRIIESIVAFSDAHLSQKGCLIFKSLKGADENAILGLKQKFKTVERFKPESSRKESSEIFIVCREKK